MARSNETPTRLRLLLVEDNPADAALMLAALEEANFTIVSAVRVQTAAQFVEELPRPVDVILCDYHLPSFNALAALRLMQESQRILPFVVVSGSIGEEIAVQAVKGGADDYLLKDRLGRLGSAIRGALEEHRLRSEAARAAADLRNSEMKYRTLFERLPEAAFLCNATDARIFDLNTRGEQLAGLERSEILGRSLSRFLAPPVMRDLLALDDSQVFELNLDFFRADERRVAARVSATIATIAQRRLLLTFFRELAPQGGGSRDESSAG